MHDDGTLVHRHCTHLHLLLWLLLWLTCIGVGHGLARGHEREIVALGIKKVSLAFLFGPALEEPFDSRAHEEDEKKGSQQYPPAKGVKELFLALACAVKTCRVGA